MSDQASDAYLLRSERKDATRAENRAIAHLEDENERLREAAEVVSAAWDAWMMDEDGDGQDAVVAAIGALRETLRSDRDQGGECCNGSSSGCGEDGCTRSDITAREDNLRWEEGLSADGTWLRRIVSPWEPDPQRLEK